MILFVEAAEDILRDGYFEKNYKRFRKTPVVEYSQ